MENFINSFSCPGIIMRVQKKHDRPVKTCHLLEQNVFIFLVVWVIIIKYMINISQFLGILYFVML